MNENFEDIKKDLKLILKKNRYEHTIGVMYTAASLAMCYEQDMKKAMLAGLLHDCAKCLSSDDTMKLCKKFSIDLSKYEMDNPCLIHAKLGAVLAEKKYGIHDADIAHAIKVHTTGEPNMNLLDKIIFVSDYIEPNRDKAPNLDEIRNMSFKDIDKAVLMILEDTLKYLDTSSASVDITTKDTYEFFLAKEGKNE